MWASWDDEVPLVEFCSTVAGSNHQGTSPASERTVVAGVIYIVSTVMCLVYAALQRSKYLQLRSKETTLADFAAFCTGFPPEPGDDLERTYTDFFASAAPGGKLVGVSICWEPGNRSGDVLRLLRQEADVRCLQLDTSKPEPVQSLCGKLEELENVTFGALLVSFPQPVVGNTVRDATLGDAAPEGDSTMGDDGRDQPVALAPSPITAPNDGGPGFMMPPLVVHEVLDAELLDDESIVLSPEAELLHEVRSSGACFAVFRTQADRDSLVQALMQPGAPTFLGKPISAEAARCEPDEVWWDRVGTCFSSGVPTPAYDIPGLASVIGAVVLWCMFAYAPFLYFEYLHFVDDSFDLRSTQAHGIALSMLLAVSNRHLCMLSAAASKRFQVHLRDQQEIAHISIYLVASLANVVLGLSAIVAAAKLAMRHREFPTDGVMAHELIRRLLGNVLYCYSLFGFFLFPVLIEVVVGMWLRSHLISLFVRTRSVNFIDTVTCLLPVNKNMARYADILRNMVVASVTLFVFPARSFAVLVCLLASGFVAYLVDRILTLRSVAHFHYSTDSIDAVAVRLLALPMSILAVGFFAQSRGMVCPAMSLIGVALLHMTVHQLLITAVRRDSNADLLFAHRRDYQTVDKERAVGWFSGNPVHGLREKYLLKRTVPPRVVCAGVSPHWNPRWHFAPEEIKSRFHNGEYIPRSTTKSEPFSDSVAQKVPPVL
jgi:hypothetical protein